MATRRVSKTRNLQQASEELAEKAQDTEVTIPDKKSQEARYNLDLTWWPYRGSTSCRISVQFIIAAGKGYTNVVRALIAGGASVDVSDDDGQTVLYVTRNVETVKVLV